MNKIKITLSSISLILATSFLCGFLSEWILTLTQNLLGLWLLVETLEMPHKFYGLTIMLFISWKLLEAVLSLWIGWIKGTINYLKENKSRKETP